MGKMTQQFMCQNVLTFLANQCLYAELLETNFHVQLFYFTSFIQVKYFQYFHRGTISQFILSMDPLFPIM